MQSRWNSVCSIRNRNERKHQYNLFHPSRTPRSPEGPCQSWLKNHSHHRGYDLRLLRKGGLVITVCTTTAVGIVWEMPRDQNAGGREAREGVQSGKVAVHASAADSRGTGTSLGGLKHSGRPEFAGSRPVWTQKAPHAKGLTHWSAPPSRKTLHFQFVFCTGPASYKWCSRLSMQGCLNL